MTSLELAERLADVAAQETLARFRTPDLRAESKGAERFDPVTEADRAAEAAMRALLARERPDDGILGEEADDVPSRSGQTWVLDPIDGTRAFISGLPVWGTLIALNDGGAPSLGLIDQPYIGERFLSDGTRALHRKGGIETPLAVRPCARLADATLFSTFPEVGTAAEGAAFHHVAGQCRLTRYGTDCYAYGLLALGQIDLVIEAGLYAYDIQGPMAVVAGAGGIVTAWDGGPAQDGGRIVAAGDARVHAAALEVLSRA
ncbi:MAG: histidinol-phosphatase [Pseudomonadota bacterium]